MVSNVRISKVNTDNFKLQNLWKRMSSLGICNIRFVTQLCFVRRLVHNPDNHCIVDVVFIYSGLLPPSSSVRFCVCVVRLSSAVRRVRGWAPPSSSTPSWPPAYSSTVSRCGCATTTCQTTSHVRSVTTPPHPAAANYSDDWLKLHSIKHSIVPC